MVVAIITHRFGTTGFQAQTRAALDQQIARWCRQYWHETGLLTLPSGNDANCIKAYFEAMGDREGLEVAHVGGV